MSKNKIINFIALQLNWFVAIYGATKSVVWPCILITGLFVYWQLKAKRRHPNDIRLVLLVIPIGLLLDSSWQLFGLVEYVSSPLPPIAPIWIMMLWITFALTLNHSMSWLKSKSGFVTALFGFIGAPLSYWAGSKLGAMVYLENIWLVSAALGISWALVTWFLMRQAALPNPIMLTSKQRNY